MDDRIFHLQDPNSFIEKLQKQCMLNFAALVSDTDSWPTSNTRAGIKSSILRQGRPSSNQGTNYEAPESRDLGHSPTSHCDDYSVRLAGSLWVYELSVLTHFLLTRIWIFQGFFRYRMLGHFTFAFEMYSKTIDLLEWGRKKWPNVPDSERGVVFKKTFIRAVKRLHLDLMHAVRDRLSGSYCQPLLTALVQQMYRR